MSFQSSEAIDPWKDPWKEVKINSDGAVSKQGTNGGGVAVFRDHNAAFLAGVSHFFPGIADLESVEVLACRRALQVAVDVHIQRAHVELDNKALVAKINEPGRNLSAVGPWVQDIKEMLNHFEEFKVTWIRRTGNMVAHNLARVGVGEFRSEIWVDSPPDFILHVISHEIPSYG
ncbi:WD repeat domain phosphoinositide-interacting protein 3 [Hordeum vulgare]|nr:WD repeat domain phosphoinositide-interacting protein 3 [Hordeum vulgare]